LSLGFLLKKKGSIKAGARVCNWRSCNPKFLRYFYQLSCCSRQSKKGDCRRLFFCFWVWWWSTLSTAESSCFGFWLLSTARQTLFFASSKQQQKGYADLNKSLQLMRLSLNLCKIIAGQRCLTAMLESGEERCTPAPLTKLHWGRGGWTHLLALWWLL
jgi:hypothetical protein